MRPKYHGKPIASLESLASALGLSVDVLNDFVTTASERYSYFDTLKKDGKLRNISSPSHDLKIIQKRINRVIFGNIEYPSYLFGGIEGKDYVKNAREHAHSKLLITLDVKNFYPSITKKLVFEIFKYFCKFPDPIASALAELTTLHGIVPQGACTSSHIANLVFYDTEHVLIRELKQKQLTYSRLLDDICISSKKELPKKQIENVIDKVVILLKAKKFQLKNSKTRISSAGNPSTLMEVTGLWLNRGAPRAHRSERLDIRTELRRCEESFKLSRFAPSYHAEHDRLSGRVAKLTYLQHFESATYRSRLRNILPHYDSQDIVKTEKLVSIIEKTKLNDRNKYSFIDRFHKILYRISIITRTNPTLAETLRKRMSIYKPINTMDEIIYGS